MPDKWTLTFTDRSGIQGTNTFDDEAKFTSGARDRLNDLRSSNISAVLSDGTKLDEKALRERYGGST